jgi:hypothetical protein
MRGFRGLDLMTQSPAEVDPRQLRDLAIKLVAEKTAGVMSRTTVFVAIR